jgi:hypothetical protein
MAEFNPRVPTEAMSTRMSLPRDGGDTGKAGAFQFLNFFGLAPCFQYRAMMFDAEHEARSVNGALDSPKDGRGQVSHVRL